MLRPARMLGLLSSPRRFPTGQPVYSRACSNEGLPSSKSAMTSRLNHLLPRQDLHLLACQRTKAARRVERRRDRFRPMASVVSALSSILANSPQVLPTFPPPPLFIPSP